MSCKYYTNLTFLFNVLCYNWRGNGKVTQKHINKGIKGSAYNCPIALALAEKGFNCRIGSEYIKIYDIDGKKFIETVTSQQMRNFIGQFDKGLEVEPETFTLR